MLHIVIEGRLRAGSLRLGLSIAGSAFGVDFDEVTDTRHFVVASACTLDEPCVCPSTQMVGYRWNHHQRQSATVNQNHQLV